MNLRKVVDDYWLPQRILGNRTDTREKNMKTSVLQYLGVARAGKNLRWKEPPNFLGLNELGFSFVREEFGNSKSPPRCFL